MKTLLTYSAVTGLCLCLFSGCASSPARVRWWAPTTWPVFSGQSKVTAAAKADASAARADQNVSTVTRTAAHTAHVSVRQADASLGTLANPPPAVANARRSLGDGLALMDQVDPLTAEESTAADRLAFDLLSADASTVALAQTRQREAEAKVSEISRQLTAANEAAAAEHKRAVEANAEARTAAVENIGLANDLRASHWRIFFVALVALVFLAVSVYVRLQLGGVGAALHHIGLPTETVSAIERETSGVGQWMIRTGRLAAAKAEAEIQALAAAHRPPAPSGASALRFGP